MMQTIWDWLPIVMGATGSGVAVYAIIRLSGPSEPPQKWIDNAGRERATRQERDAWNDLYAAEEAEDEYRAMCERLDQAPDTDVIRGIYGR